ncbi:MAG: hypothetical protein M0R66_07910 [Candidatus Omnitrophica bacterium]|nr:hypothetical protein [Candidatus Omnitrophota bacterium]
MKEPRNKAVSIIELLISIILLSVIVLALASIDLFSRYHVVNSDQRARLQNQVYFVVEHMSREVSGAIGNENVYGADTVVNQQSLSGGDDYGRVRVYVDGNGDGIRQPPSDHPNPAAGDDHWIAYLFYDNTASSNKNSIRYCGRCTDNNTPCPNGNAGACAIDWVTLSSNIQYFIPTKPAAGGILSQNYLDVEIIGCNDPTSGTCGNLENPIVTFRTNMKMPSVAVR